MEINDQIQIFRNIFNVPRETIEKLERYHELIVSNQKKFNLIGKGTLESIWIRHFGDSAKLLKRVLYYRKKFKTEHLEIIDVGTGAGFPGVVFSVLVNDLKIKADISLIESNRKKCNFLELVKIELGQSFKIFNSRAEEITNITGNIIFSRAVAPLGRLFNILVNLVNKESVLLLHKGKNWQKEIAESKKGWQFDYNIVKNDIVLDRSGGVTIEVMNLLRK